MRSVSRWHVLKYMCVRAKRVRLRRYMHWLHPHTSRSPCLAFERWLKQCSAAIAVALPCPQWLLCHTHDEIIALAEHNEKASAIYLGNRIADRFVEIRDSL